MIDRTPISQRRARRNRTSVSGMVLIMALAALAVMTLLLLALFQGASHQIRGAQSDAALAREKMLADSAVALVIGQIEQASAQTNQAWISQPGLLRTYTNSAVRVPTACYKLYSTSSLTNMTDTSGTVAFMASDVPANWSSLPSQYTDLNAPVQTPGLFGQMIYPILDTNALANVEGVSSDSGAVTMPVAWLYELQDGTLGPASNGTAANPIVARIAFWTDDDTSKIDINTAGCGSPWNTPHLNSTNDVAWSTTQPAEGEYSAYPGHPAMTSLTAVFGNSYSPQQLLGLTPRYAWGGSEFGAQTTTANESVPTKLDRLYASVDELGFSTNLSSTGQRQTNQVSATQLELARFVLTAHSVAPETTMLGEPRVAIWPVADSTSASAPRMTAFDNALTNVATIGAGTTNVRQYFFQRTSPLNPLDDFNPAQTNLVPTGSNVQLFDDLVNRGNLVLPGYGTSMSAKYPGAGWTQLMLEITDYIHSLNAVDPSPAPFVPFAAGGANNLGYGYVDPLNATYAAGTTNQVTLRGIGRCPTLSSLTLVFYVCGFTFDTTATATLGVSSIDFEKTPDTNGAFWTANLEPSSTIWQHVTGELVRAFVVPCTFQPGCGYPEVSDNCTIQISGLNEIGMTTATANDFGFTNGTATSDVLGNALGILPQDRAWGGNEGPLAWRAAAVDAQGTGAFSYAFAGTKALTVAFPGTTRPSYSATAKTLTFPNLSSLVFHGVPGLTVTISDASGNALQTLSINLPANVGVPAPTCISEYPVNDAGNTVQPSYYMTLKNRVLATQGTRPFLIQPEDTSRSMEAATDLRIIAGLTNVPSTFFTNHPSYKNPVFHAHNLHFSNGTAVYGASGTNSLFGPASYPGTTANVAWTNWCDGATSNYAWPISPPCSSPTTLTASSVTMMPAQNSLGDWDTGPGFAPDGAQINLPDAGTTNTPANAYFSLSGGCVGAPTQRTPNALVPSPVIFGSLPAGINPGTPASSAPWRTLLFNPYPAANTSTAPYAIHPGAASPPDHLVLDNFWMPVLEPYAISTRMATAGKINLNDQIAPFTYLHRNTALHALLNDLRVPAIPATTAASVYKSAGAPLTGIWNAVDENATIAQIENKFANNSADAYLSESEICTVPIVPQGLVPQGTSVSGAQTLLEGFWNGSSASGGLTGNNLRDLPYAQLYGRLTTRSNSYTVHLRVQVLQKLRGDPHQNVWNEGVDLVQGDWRGSYEIERYLDPAAAAPALDPTTGLYKLTAYKFRILSARQFAP